MAEDNFEAVDPLARVSKEAGLALFGGDLALVTDDIDEIPLDSADPDGKPFDEDDELFDAGPFDKTHDPVRLYLREMGAVPLLNRESEIALARRIERGQNRTRRMLARCPFIIEEIERLGSQVASGAISTRDVLTFNDPIPGEDTFESGAAELISSSADLAILRRKCRQLRNKLDALKAKSKPGAELHLRWELGRAAVQITRIVCGLHLQHPVVRDLIARLRRAVVENTQAEAPEHVKHFETPRSRIY